MADTTGPQQTAAGRGSRTAGRRPGAPKVNQPNDPGLFRFVSMEDGSGLKIGPVTVLVMSLAYMVIVVFLHIMAKFKSAMTG